MSGGPGHALVIGGTRGLGRVVAGRFLDRGHAVTVVSRRVPDAPPDGTVHLIADLETLTDATDVIARVVDAGGPVRYVVFCQRYRGQGDAWNGEIQVGLTATRLLIDGLRPHFVTEGDRAIGVVSSVYGAFAGGSQPVGYHVVKAGLNQMVRYYAWELGRLGIRANAIMPLTFIKPESKAYYGSQTALMQLYDDFVPLRRPGSADDSANLLDFLCSAKAAFINGQCIFVDGGVSVVWQEEMARRLTGV
jgi:NAD(P)-dependent dehydrogenase (short-subunit alcohol dehydrogenase family)